MPNEKLPPAPDQGPIDYLPQVRRQIPSASPVQGQGSGNLPPAPTSNPINIPTTDTARKGEMEVIGPDVAKSSAAGLPLGVAQMIGMPGTIKEAVVSYGMPALVGMGASVAEGLGYISPSKSEEIKEKAWEFGPKFYKSAIESESQRFPTVEEAEKYVKEYLPFTKYKPETTYGKYAKSAAEGVGSGAIGKFSYFPSRAAIGASSGIGSEFGAQVAADYPPLSKAGAQVAGALVGGITGGKITNMIREFFPNVSGAGTNRVFQALAEDIANGQSKLNMDQINEAIRSGQPLTLADIAGPRSLSIIENYGGRTSEANKAVREFFKEAAPTPTVAVSARDSAREKRFEKFRDEFTSSYGHPPMTSVELKAEADNLGSALRKNMYDILRQNPAAQNISANNFADLYMKPEFRKAVDDAMNSMANAPLSWGIKGTRSPVTFTAKNTGEKFNPVDGNLSFYDHVKRSLDEEISRIRSALESSRESSLASPTRLAYLEDMRNDLVRKLDSIVPDYKTTRSAAAETFKASNAVEAGHNFLSEGTKPGNKLFREISRMDIRNAFNSFTPQEKFLFKAALYDKITSISKDQNTFNSFAKSLAKPNEHFSQSLRGVLGDVAFERLRNRTMIENTLSNISSIIESAEIAAKNPSSLKQVGTTAFGLGALGTAGPVAMNLLNDFALLSQVRGVAEIGASGGIAALSGAVYKLMDTKAKAEMSKTIIPLIMSGDPKDLNKLQQIMKTGAGSEIVSDVMGKLQSLSAATGRAVQGYDQAISQQAGQASGGRVARASGGRIVHEDAAEKLIRAAEIAKKSIGKQTETILEKPDEHVVQALAVANRHI